MNKLDFAYSVAYIRAIENRLMSGTDIESLIASKNCHEAMQILLDKGYGTELTAPENFEELLRDRLQHCWKEVTEVMPEGAGVDILLYKNDFHNLKVVLKALKQGDKEYERYFISPCTINCQSIVTAVAGEKFSELPPMLCNVAKESYELLSATSDSQLSDVLIDKAAMDYLYDEACKSGSDFLKGFISLQNTFTDIKIAVRCARTGKNADFTDRALSARSQINRDDLIRASLQGEVALIDELGNQGFNSEADALRISLSEFEKYADNKLNDYLDESKYITLGIEPLIAYIHRASAEIQAVRIIMSAKLNNFDEESIRSRLRNFA